MEQILIFVVLYVAVAILVYYFVKGMLLLDINSTNELEMDIEKDKIPMTMACAFVGMIWIIYIPYLILKVSVDNFQRD